MIKKQTACIIEFMGMPAAGKSTCCTALLDKKIKDNTHYNYYTNEGIPSCSSDTPSMFNKRLLSLLKQAILTHASPGPLLLDRGILDAQIWLNLHCESGNIDPTAAEELYEEINLITTHILNNKIPHYKILFMQSPITSLKRRTTIRGRADEWAMEINMLRRLNEKYELLTSSKKVQSYQGYLKYENDIYVINSEQNLETVQSIFTHIVLLLINSN